MVQSQKMDRGSDAMKTHLGDSEKISVRQTRKGWFQELLGCEAKTEFRYMKDGNQFASSLEESGFCCRLFCSPIQPYTMVVQEEGTNAEILSVERPFKCAVGFCKCCCYQEMTFTSGGNTLGMIKEDYSYCVPQFTVYDEQQSPIYKIHQPTCCGGCCVNCCAEGKSCFAVCCKVPFHVFPASQEETGGDAAFLGKILKLPKSLMTEVFTDANAFDVTFPADATADQKAMLVGTAVFINSNFFEGGPPDNS